MTTVFIKAEGKQHGEFCEVDQRSGKIRLGATPRQLAQLRLAVPTRGAVYGAALNFKGTLARIGSALFDDPYKRPPNAPVLYMKPANTWIGHGWTIPCSNPDWQLRMGGTLGVVIGETACRVTLEHALKHVGGYTIVNDVSIPHESYYRPAIRQRCRDGFCSIGPWIVGPNAISNSDSVEIRIQVNGETRSVSNTSSLVRNVATLIADITEFMTLRAGDLLLVGEPDNAPLASPGDRVRIEIDEIGWLENSLGSEELDEVRAL